MTAVTDQDDRREAWVQVVEELARTTTADHVTIAAYVRLLQDADTDPADACHLIRSYVSARVSPADLAAGIAAAADSAAGVW